MNVKMSVATDSKIKLVLKNQLDISSLMIIYVCISNFVYVNSGGALYVYQ